ncbi:MAG: type II toxin-antitoxin system VapC family toxin [Verrucomicrobia bacterium]|nr:type II toxin-antitoxin system VapC family toxin [Verrucomicrobiota bacterium]
MSYWDTSCLVKLYVTETDSAQFDAYALTTSQMVTSEIARFEMWTTLRRKEAEGQIAPGAARALFQLFKDDVTNGEIILIPTDGAVKTAFDAIIDHCHGHLPPLPIRTLDSIHLAAARVAHESEIVTADKRLRDAAIFEGFSVFPPP